MRNRILSSWMLVLRLERLETRDKRLETREKSENPILTGD
jgi:hypothetical protein